MRIEFDGDWEPVLDNTDELTEETVYFFIPSTILIHCGRKPLFNQPQARHMAIVKIKTMFASTVVACSNVYNWGGYTGYNIGCTPFTYFI